MKNEMRISGCVLKTDAASARLSAKITCADGQPRELWFSLPAAHADWFATDRCDGFVVGLLLQAMERNENIVTEAPMSSRLWHSLSQFYIPMMTQAFPNLHRIEILPAALTTEVKPAGGVATGFSGGIDSFAAVVRHFAQEKSPEHRVTHFLFHNVGSHGTGNAEADRRLFRQRYATVQPFAKEAGIPAVPVDSNLGHVFPMDYVKTYSAVNPAVLLVLQNKFRRYYYASGYKYADCRIAPVKDIAYLDPMAVHLLSTESLDCVATGGEMSRVEKTAFVAGGIWMPSRQSLAKLRDRLADDWRPFSKLVEAPSFRRRFGAFTSEAMLTRVPRGFAPDHPAAKWLRFQSFTASRNLPSADLPSPKLVGKVVRDFEALAPLVRWINGSLGFKPAKSRL